MHNRSMKNDNNEQIETLKKRGLLLINDHRLEEAKALFEEISSLYPEDAEAWYLLSNINGRLGNIDEAGDCCRRTLAIQPGHSAAHVNFGNVLHSQGRLDAAADSYQLAIHHNPNLSVAYVNLGNLRMQQKEHEKAVNNYRQAIHLTPNVASLRYSLGIALSKLGRHEEAMESFQEAVRLKPDYVNAYNNMGNILLRRGNQDEAIAAFQQALSCEPGSPAIHNNLGAVYLELQMFDEALACFQRALEIDPCCIAALNNLAKACRFLDRYDSYVKHYRKAVDLMPDPAEARIVFARHLKYMTFFGYSPWLENELIKCLSMDGIIHNTLLLFTTGCLKDKYDIRQPAEYDDNAIKTLICKICSDALFMMFLKRTTNADADLEILLTRIRRSLLIKISQENNPDPGELRLAAGIAHQCFNNEHVFALDDHERRQVAILKETIEQSVPSLSSPNAELQRNLLAFGMYENFYSLSCRKEINAMPETAWTEAFRPLLKAALANPLEEEEIQKEIASIAPAKSAVSQLIQSQYEENPYPRWLSTPKVTMTNIRQFAKKTFPHLALPPAFDGPIRILIAGCGTGEHPIQAALGYDNAEVLAVDISKSSLAYGIRMARESGVHNIQFMQADILELSNLDSRFHMIECIGVLHHMEDPLQGWKILSNLLVEDGIMSIGLYSEKGRRDIVTARKIISDKKTAPDKTGIRDFRTRVINREFGDQLHDDLCNTYDFYSISGCRDLLFNFVEHRFTIPRIATIIDDLDLKFIGFGFETDQIHNLYRDRFPQDKEMTNLSFWDLLEEEHPNIFGRMYQFWCQMNRKAA